MEEIPYQNGMNLGLGYDVLKNDGLVSSALDNVNLLRPVVQASGQKVNFSVEMLSNSISLAEQIGVSASASMSYGTASGSAKVSLVQGLKQNSFSVYVLVKVHVQNQQTLLDLTQIKMSDKAQLLYATNQTDFLNQYGTHFIYGLISGGEYYGILEIESKSAEDYRSIKAELSGKGMVGVMSASASGSFEKSLNRLASSYKLKATVIRDGAEGMLQPITPDELIKGAINFPAGVLNDKAIPFSVLIFPYTQIPHPNVEEIPIGERKDCLNKVARLYGRFIRQRSDLQYAIENSELFPGLDKVKLEDYIIKIDDQLDKFKARASNTVSLSEGSKCEDFEYDKGLLDYILPLQVGPSQLGYTWFIKNGEWTGIWKRNGETDSFNCYEQKTDNGNTVTFQARVYISGDDVVIFRTDTKDSLGIPTYDNPSYQAKLQEDGRTVKADVGKWMAVIDQRRL
ncbi:MAC/perforin domain-containing protein [Peribacillus sp. NPDC060186]